MDRPLTRQGSGALARSLAQIISGEQANPEQIPLTRNTSAIREEVARRREEIQRELMERLIFRFVPAFCCTFLLLASLFLVYAIVFAIAFFATVQHFDRPCDQPFKYYMPIYITWNLSVICAVPIGTKCILDWIGVSTGLYTVVNFLLTRILLALPALIGLYMLWNSKTCSKTNSGLYYPLKWLVILQIIVNISFLVALVMFFLLGRNLTAMMSMVGDGLGCKDAIHKLPKVALDSKELIDEEDGNPSDCSICMERMSGGEKVVVRTFCAPRQHYFHEECLSRWCENEVTCPMCRSVLGDLDERV